MAAVAGLTPTGRATGTVGGGGLVRVRTTDGRAGLLRYGAVGSTADPRPCGEFLRRLGPSPVRPAVLATGEHAGWGFSVESELRGRTPRRVDAALVEQVTDQLAGSPQGDPVPATGPGRDLRTIADLLGADAVRLAALADEVDERLAAVPGTVVHGDLWAGNLLVRGGRLTGIVDWDAARVDGVAGQDVLHLVAMARRRATGEDLPTLLAARPWRWPPVARAIALGSDAASPADEVLGWTVGYAWWARHVAGTLTRVPARRHDLRWLRRHVHPVVAGR